MASSSARRGQASAILTLHPRLAAGQPRRPFCPRAECLQAAGLRCHRRRALRLAANACDAGARLRSRGRSSTSRSTPQRPPKSAEGRDWRLAPVTWRSAQLVSPGVWGDGPPSVAARQLDSCVECLSPGLASAARADFELLISEPNGGTAPGALITLHPHRIAAADAGHRALAGPQARGRVSRRPPRRPDRPHPPPAAASGRRLEADQRLLAAPLGGGIRYSAQPTPMSFATPPGHQLTGPVGIAVISRRRRRTKRLP